MNAVTYSKPEVIDFLNKEIVSIQVPFDSQPLATTYALKWTPTLIILDQEGKEHQRTVGYVPPEDFIPLMLLGIGKTCFDADRFSEALERFEKIISRYPKSSSAHEAIYLRGVAGYKSTHEIKPLKDAYEKLSREYPDSEWAKRAQPYSLL